MNHGFALGWEQVQKAGNLLTRKTKQSILIVLCISIVISNGVGFAHAQPAVTVLQATDVTDTSAQLRGFVNPNGQNAEWYFFVWTDAPGPHNNNYVNCPTPSGNLPGSDATDPVSCMVQVDPSTTYSFVLVAKWSGGESATSDTLQFTTLPTIVIVTATMMSFQTDWELSNPTMSPAHPKVGDRVAFAVTLTALASNVGYPQTVRFTFALDGTHIFFDTAQYDYPGPTGNAIRLEAGIDEREIWLATSGSHTVEWTIEPVIVGLIITDPKMSNNHVSLPFSVSTAAPAFDFTLSVSPGSVPVKQGDTAHYMVQISYSDPSYSGTIINIQVAGLGPGMDWDLPDHDLAIMTKPTTPTGTYTIAVVGSAMGVTRQASATLVVTAGQPPPTQFDFGLLISPTERTVSPGGSATYTVTVNLIAGSAQDVALSLSGPADMMATGKLSGTFSSSSGNPDPTFSSTLTITTSSSVSSGRFSLMVTGSGGGRTHTTTFDVMVLSTPTTVTQPPPSQPSTVLVTTTKTTIPPPGPGFPDLTWIIIGILAVLIIIFAAFALRRRQPAYPPAPPPSARPTQPAPPTPTEKPKPSSLYCVRCGTENPPTNEYCGKCGQELLRPS